MPLLRFFKTLTKAYVEVSADNPLPVTMATSGNSLVVNPDGSITAKTAATNPNIQTSTVANGASLSGANDLAGETLVGIHMPAVWTAANLTFQVSEDGITYDNLYDRFGNETVYTTAAARFMPVLPSEWIGIRYIKVRSGTSGVPVAQAAARAIVLVTKAV